MKTLRLITGAALVLGLTACSGGGTADSDNETNVGDSDELTKLTVGVVPVADYAPLYIAQENGYFEEEGLDVEIQTMQNFAAIAPSVLNDQVQLGAGAYHPLVSAISEGLPLVAVANSSQLLPGPENDVSAIMVQDNSDISSLEDLSGKVVAVNAINSVVHVLAVTSLEEAGVSADQVEFVPMSYSEMYPAIEQGSVDAMAAFEPFVTLATQEGGRSIEAPISTSYPDGGSTGGYFASQDFVADNGDVLEAFAIALEKGVADAAEDNQLVRDFLIEEASMDPDVVAEMRLPDFSEVPDSVDVASFERTNDIMVEHGFIPEPIDIESSTWQRP